MYLRYFLDFAPKLPETERYKRLDKNKKYYEGTQYERRTTDACGYAKGTRVKPSSSGTSWEDRDPGAVINVRRDVVQELTSWSLGGDAFCAISCPDDEQTNLWLRKAIEASGLATTLVEARNGGGGAQGTAIVSFAIRNGRIQLESHEPVSTWVLEWRDRTEYRPAVVAKVFEEVAMLARPGEPGQLVVRVWTENDEVYYRRERDERGDYVWRVISSVVHGFGFCPVYWCPQTIDTTQIDGDHDGEHTAGSIDDANYQFAAASATTLRNAEDTLVVKEDPNMRPTTLYKGAMGAIFARGGAEYLSQDGASARICIEMAEKRIQHVHRASRVVIPSLEDLGRAVTAAAQKKMFEPMLQRAKMIREWYEKRLIVPLMLGLLAAARKLPPGSILLPPEVEESGAIRLVVPGKSNNLTVVWPEQIQPTAADFAATVQGCSAAVTAKIMSRRTAVRMLQRVGAPIEDVDAELEEIERDASEAAEMAAKALGMAEPPGSAGPVGGAEDDGEEAPESEREDTAAE